MIIFTMPEGKVIAIDPDYVSSVQPGSCAEPGQWTMIDIDSRTTSRVWVRGEFYDVVNQLSEGKM